MTREESIQKLLRYMPQNDAEKKFKEDMINFFHAHPDCYERSLTVGHFTASAWLLDKTGTKALLMHHAKLNRWLQLGGHCDGDPDTLAVAIKEAQEESGIQSIVPVSTEIFDIDVHLIPAHKDVTAHYHYDIRYLLQVTGNEEIVKNEESRELRWLGKHGMHELALDSSVIRMRDKWIDLDSKLPVHGET
jgi:8-oxo-dGTP pyrophosphatase MutT (NUDIX family)